MPLQFKRLRIQLAALDTATTIDDMDLPGFRLHPLKGDQSRDSGYGSASLQVAGSQPAKLAGDAGCV